MAAESKVNSEVKLMLAAWWERDGLNLREITFAQAVTQMGKIQSTHPLDYEREGDHLIIKTLVYVFQTKYLPRDAREPLGLDAKALAHLTNTVGAFLQAISALSQRHSGGLSLIWQQSTALSTYPYNADRKFRDCPARDVDEWAHALGYHFDATTQQWKVKEQP